MGRYVCVSAGAIMLAGALLTSACSSNKNPSDKSPAASSTEAVSPKETKPGQPELEPPPAPDAGVIAAPPAVPAIAIVPNTVRLVVPFNDSPKRSETRLLERLAKKLKKLGALTADKSNPEEMAYLGQIGSDASLPDTWLPYETVVFFGPGVSGVFHPPGHEPVYMEQRSDTSLAISEDLAEVALALKPDATREPHATR